MPFDLRLKPKFTMIICGPSKSGKTTFLRNLLLNSRYEEQFMQKPAYVLLYYTNHQILYDALHEIGVINEMIDLSVPRNMEEFNKNNLVRKVSPYKDGNGSLVIFDDTLSDVNKEYEKIFGGLGNHYNTSLIFFTQNLYYNNNSYRNISLQMEYFVIMANPRSRSQILYMARMMCPGNSKGIMEIYDSVVRDKPYSYLFFDFVSGSPKEILIRTNIFLREQPYTVYIES